MNNKDITAKRESNLSSIETTTGANGYPRDLRKALIGFQSMEEAKTLADECGGEVYEFVRRDGWTLWLRRQCVGAAYDSLDMVDGDNYEIYFRDTMQDWFHDFKRDELDAAKTADDFEDACARFTEIKEAFDGMDDDDFLLIQCGRLHDVRHREEVMGYADDSKHYAIGVLLPRNAAFPVKTYNE